MKYWIKERDNPQLGVYFIACGKMSNKKAVLWGRSIYGSNTMHSFDNESDYLARIAELKKLGRSVQ